LKRKPPHIRTINLEITRARGIGSVLACQQSELSAAPEQNPNWLHVRAPQQSQSEMQVEAAAVLQECVST
jgi:hypothetical protein